MKLPAAIRGACVAHAWRMRGACMAHAWRMDMAKLSVTSSDYLISQTCSTPLF